MASGAPGAGEAAVVGTNTVAVRPTVSILDPIVFVGAIIWPDSFTFERVDLLVEGLDLMSETLDVLRLGGDGCCLLGGGLDKLFKD